MAVADALPRERTAADMVLVQEFSDGIHDEKGRRRKLVGFCLGGDNLDPIGNTMHLHTMDYRAIGNKAAAAVKAIADRSDQSKPAGGRAQAGPGYQASKDEGDDKADERTKRR